MIEEVSALLEKGNVVKYQEYDIVRPKLWASVCKAQKDYLEAREKFRYPPNDPKTKGEPKLTDFDRQTMLNAQTAQLLHDYELLKGYYDILTSRIEIYDASRK